MKLLRFRYATSQILTKRNNQINNQLALNRIFSSESVKERIHIFRQLQDVALFDNTIQRKENPNLIIDPEQRNKVKNPTYLKFDTAKNLSQFVKTNKISSNIRILHALAHIEYNAFMAYTDTYFHLSHQVADPMMRRQFQKDIKKIAIDEGDHFCMLNDRLQTLGWKYGSLPVIDQLCLAIKETQTCLLERIARISLLHEGKGMKAIAKLISQIQKQKDFESIKILKVIESEQIYHFQNGVKWFAYICRQQNKDLKLTCEQLMKRKQFQLISLEDILKTSQKFQI